MDGKGQRVIDAARIVYDLYTRVEQTPTDNVRAKAVAAARWLGALDVWKAISNEPDNGYAMVAAKQLLDPTSEASQVLERATAGNGQRQRRTRNDYEK